MAAGRFQADLPDAMTVAIDSAAPACRRCWTSPSRATVNALLCRGVICLAPIGDVQALLATWSRVNA